MSDTVIKLQGIGKKYRIRHQRQQRYATLRDTIAEKVRSAFRSDRTEAETSNTVEDFWALRDISFEIKAGDVVVIFPEGRITDTGELYPFRPGITRILQANPVPVVPMALRGLWGSFFSRQDGAAMTKPWRLAPFKRIGLAVGDLVAPAAATPEALQERVLALRGEWR